jgi:hypothetical protein
MHSYSLRRNLPPYRAPNKSAAKFRGIKMKTKTLTLFAAMTLFVALGITAQTFARKTQDQIITFDAGPNGTTPMSINPRGEITGWYYDASYVVHGFERGADGTITTFEAPGASTVSFLGTYAQSINPSGEITGYYYDASFVAHGFVRAADGTVTTFDGPGASPNGTYATGINKGGEITGSYSNFGGGTHGFLRDRDGNFITFDASGVNSDSSATFPTSITSSSEITGYYTIDPTGFILHGFVRAADGTITAFSVGEPRTVPQSINPSGEITGYYSDGVGHGFVRAADGTITTFDGPGASPSGTYATAINPSGEVVGNYSDYTIPVAHGFVRAADGTFTTFDAGPNSTFPTSINSSGMITGYYDDASFVAHGFMRKR